jgi:hypothetical protein
MTRAELLEIAVTVDEMDLPDGAHFAMIEELSGMDAIDFYTELECSVCGCYDCTGGLSCESGDGL